MRELPGGLALKRSGAGAGEGENGVRVELAHVEALALGLIMPAGQDNGNL
jgi:hypothetical protein